VIFGFIESVIVNKYKLVLAAAQVGNPGNTGNRLCDIFCLTQDGSFIVRRSERGGASRPYTLAVFYGDRVYNLHIRLKSNSKYALGTEKEDEIVSKRTPIAVSFNFILRN
jgi:hypothetical protein